MMVAESTRKGDMKGRPNPAQENCDGSDLELCPDLVLAALAAVAAAAFGVLFTLITGAGRKKKRSTDLLDPVPFNHWIEDLSWHLGILNYYLERCCTVSSQHIPQAVGIGELFCS